MNEEETPVKTARASDPGVLSRAPLGKSHVPDVHQRYSAPAGHRSLTRSDKAAGRLFGGVQQALALAVVGPSTSGDVKPQALRMMALPLLDHTPEVLTTLGLVKEVG